MGTRPDWWREFFSGLFVDFWLAAPTPDQTRQEADFLQGALQVAPPARLLDVPCGGGRHCHDLAGRGFAMTGVDLSTGFLDAARSTSRVGPGSVAWEHREMRDLPWPDQFDGAYSFGNSFGYLDETGNADFLDSVFRTLKPGARFVLETSYLMEVLLPSLQDRSWYEVGGIVVLSDRRYDPAESRLHVDFTCIRGGSIERRSMSARLYSYREVVRLLRDAGFAEIETYGSLTRDPFKMGPGRLLAVARKPQDRP